MEPLRSAAREAITSLGHQPVMVEDLGAKPSSPQVVCLDGLRQSDIVVLILGERYGATLPSGLSATYEEYREARDRKPVLAFIQRAVSQEPKQAEFISEVQGWEGGLFRADFTGPADLRSTITRALHEWELANAVGPLDTSDLLTRALAGIPREQHGYVSGTASLIVSIAYGPAQSVLRPAEIEASSLADALLEAALFGEWRIFDHGKGSTTAIVDHALVLKQEDGIAAVSFDEQGAMIIKLPIAYAGHGLPVLIEENVLRQLSVALGYAGWLLERIDPTHRLTHFAIAAQLYGAGSLGWRTQQEHEASPNQIVGGLGFGNERSTAVHLTPPHRPRAALRLDAGRLVEDLVVLLRRQRKP